MKPGQQMRGFGSFFFYQWRDNMMVLYVSGSCYSAYGRMIVVLWPVPNACLYPLVYCVWCVV